MDDFKESKPYSRELPPLAALATSLPVRISKHEDDAAKVSKNFTKKLERMGLPITSPTGLEYLGHAEFGHLICLGIPECLPERIPALVKAFDSFCIIDSWKDDQINDRKQGSSVNWRNNVAMKLLLAEQGLAILIQQPFSGFRYMKRCLINLKARKDLSPTLPKEGASFVDLFPTRFLDIGSPGMIASLEFGMGIKLTRDEAKTVHELSVFACTAAALSNDIFSWPMEQLEQRNTQVPPFSCIGMLMQEFSCSEEGALLRCRYKLLQYENACQELSRELRDNPVASLDVKRMALAYTHMVSGCGIWQASCARYRCQNSSMDLVRQVMGTALPTVELDKAFKEESEKILLGCSAILRKNLRYSKR